MAALGGEVGGARSEVQPMASQYTKSVPVCIYSFVGVAGKYIFSF